MLRYIIMARRGVVKSFEQGRVGRLVNSDAGPCEARLYARSVRGLWFSVWRHLHVGFIVHRSVAPSVTRSYVILRSSQSPFCCVGGGWMQIADTRSELAFDTAKIHELALHAPGMRSSKSPLWDSRIMGSVLRSAVAIAVVLWEICNCLERILVLNVSMNAVVTATNPFVYIRRQG